jgi:hypothetical protein
MTARTASGRGAREETQAGASPASVANPGRIRAPRVPAARESAGVKALREARAPPTWGKVPGAEERALAAVWAQSCALIDRRLLRGGADGGRRALMAKGVCAAPVP